MGFGRTVIFNLFNTLKKLKFIPIKKETKKDAYPKKPLPNKKQHHRQPNGTFTILVTTKRE